MGQSSQAVYTRAASDGVAVVVGFYRDDIPEGKPESDH